MRLKKILALMLVGCLTFSVVACGEKEDANSENSVTGDENNSKDNSETESSSENESTSENGSETDEKTPITEADASAAAVAFTKALMSGDVETTKGYFPYDMSDDEWEATTGSLGSFASMNGKETDITDGITAKMYFELKFEPSEPKQVSDDELAQLKSTIEASPMYSMASYDFADVSAVYVIAVVMSMDMWLDDWSVDSSVVTLTDEELEQLKTTTNASVKEQGAENKMGFAICVADINCESKVIIFETISEE